ncbi:MAG: beta propeller repeat protein [Acidimicrobiales bacterium]
MSEERLKSLLTSADKSDELDLGQAWEEHLRRMTAVEGAPVENAAKGSRRILSLAVIGVSAVVVVSALLLSHSLGLSSHGGELRASSTTNAPSHRSTSPTPNHALSFVAAGARLDDGNDAWVLGKSSLAVTRNGGAQWTRLPLPTLPSGYRVIDVSVLPTETVAVVANPGGYSSMEIDTIARGQSRWQSTTVSAGTDVGAAEIIDSNGVLAGVMITQMGSSAVSAGVWLATPDAGKTWRVDRAPVGGVATIASGVWLVGGVPNSSVYFRPDGGSGWERIRIPVTIAGPVSYGPIYADGGRIVLTASAGTVTQVVTGSRGGPIWRWRDGPVLRLGGKYGGGAPALSSLADGILWVVSPVDRVGRVALTAGKISEAKGHGLPANGGSLALYAMGGQAAWAVFSSFSCSHPKSGCPATQGLLRTTDGGAVWKVMPDPLAS